MSMWVASAVIHAEMRVIKHRLWNPLIEQTHRPDRVQELLLRRILAEQVETTFGKKHHFRDIRTYRDYSRRVPIQSYEDLRPYIDDQEQTKEPTLNIEQPFMYVQTSGTTGKPKQLPLVAATRAATFLYQRLFAYAQYQGVPGIFRGNVLVIAGQAVEGRLETGTPYGSMSGFLSRCLPWGLKRKNLFPDHVHGLTTYDQKYLHIAACALAAPSLSVLATPNPSTIQKLLDVIRRQFPLLLDLISPQREARAQDTAALPLADTNRWFELTRLAGQEDRLTVASLWPSLKAVITWTGGNCGLLIPRLKAALPDQTVVIEMGYLSSECLGSLNVDVTQNRCIPTFYENLFEFVELEQWDRGDRETLTLDQVQEGKKYHVIVTTRSGLYRYFMNDIVVVTGHFHRTPTIQFLQKGKGVTNLTGEKLYEHQLLQAMDRVMKACGASLDFYMMLADPNDLQYTLYVEHPALEPAIGSLVEKALGEENIEFKAKLESGRLKPVRVIPLRVGMAEAYKQHCLQNGQREAQFKLVKLQYTKDCSFDFTRYAKA